MIKPWPSFPTRTPNCSSALGSPLARFRLCFKVSSSPNTCECFVMAVCVIISTASTKIWVQYGYHEPGYLPCADCCIISSSQIDYGSTTAFILLQALCCKKFAELFPLTSCSCCCSCKRQSRICCNSCCLNLLFPHQLL